MAKTPTDIRLLARRHTKPAMNALISVMNSPDANPSARVAAANAILDRGYGKPDQTHKHEGGDNPIQGVMRIELVPLTGPNGE